jgi:hypothetical protein
VRRARNRRGRRRGDGEARGDWSMSSGLEGAVEINGGVVQQVGGGDLLWDNGGRSGSETTGKAAPSKRWRATGSSSQHPRASAVVIHFSTLSKVSPLLSTCRSSHGSWRDASTQIESVGGTQQAAVRREAGI